MSTEKKNSIIGVKLTDALNADVSDVSVRWGISRQEVIRRLLSEMFAAGIDAAEERLRDWANARKQDANEVVADVQTHVQRQARRAARRSKGRGE